LLLQRHCEGFHLIFAAIQERRSSPSVNRGKIQHGGESNFVSKGRIVYSRSICVSDGSEDFDEADFFDSLSYRQSRRSVPLVVPIHQLHTKYVKPKGKLSNTPGETKTYSLDLLGVKREYEFLESVQKVLALDDDDDTGTTMSDDEWEPVYVNRGSSVERKSYSLVVAGG
jgi:hypothetical protein